MRDETGMLLFIPHPSALIPALLPAERLDLHVDAGRKVELHQRVYGLRRRVEDVHQALVRANLELLARLLVHVRRPQDRPLVLRSGERYRPRHARARALRRLDDLRRGLVEHAVVVSLESDSDLFVQHVFKLSTFGSQLSSPSGFSRRLNAFAERSYSTISETVPAPPSSRPL